MCYHDSIPQCPQGQLAVPVVVEGAFLAVQEPARLYKQKILRKQENVKYH